MELDRNAFDGASHSAIQQGDPLLANLHSRLTLNDQGLGPDALELEQTQAQTLYPQSASSNQVGIVIAKIENIFESIIDNILTKKNVLTVQLRVRKKSKICSTTDRQADATEQATRTLSFPNKNPKEAWKFILLRILELSHEALVTGIVTTKRDIYYKDPELFIKQEVVDRYVDDIAYTFGVERHALNVVAAAKGLIVGMLKATRIDKSVIDLVSEPEGILVPNPATIESVYLKHVSWILVIEKEATFRTLATSQYWKHSIAGHGILVTAKGYPDIQTRRFLHFLSTNNSITPLFALVDYDPDGLGILSTYQHGSVNLSHEGNLAVPSIRWLGVRSSDFLHTECDVQGLLSLTKRDRRMAEKILERQHEIGEMRPCDVDYRRELQVMLMLNVKAEIQILGNGERLGQWLDEKLSDAAQGEDFLEG